MKLRSHEKHATPKPSMRNIPGALSDANGPASIRGGISLAIVAMLLAVSLSACGSSASSTSSAAKSPTPTSILNTKRIALAIEQSILSKRHIHAKVFCPKVVPQQKGRNFACIATVGKTKTPFTVVQQSNSGYVTYHAE